MMERKKILVVDDEATLTRMIKRNLEATGKYEVLEENSGARAIEAARGFGPDLIVLDVMMPDADGGEVAFRLGEDSLLRDVPVVFLTAIVKEQETGAEGKVIAGKTFLSKPVKFSELQACIDKHLGA